MAIARWPHRVPEPIDSNAVLDYRIDWSDWLSEGEAISESEWTVIGAAKVASSFTNTAATIWLSPSSTGTVTASNRITTDSAPISRVDERTLILDAISR